MKAGILAASAALAAVSPAHQRGCDKLFTVKMGERAGRAVYAGTRHVTRRDLRLLGYIERCQRNPRAGAFVRAFDHRLAQEHWVRTWPQGGTSWYDDGGATACGFHAYYGVANLSLACGTKVDFAYYGRRVTAVVDDRGPYVGGRIWDLNQNTAGALGFGGVGSVSYWIH